MTPKSAMASMNRLVAIGRRMKTSEIFTAVSPDAVLGRSGRVRFDLDAAARNQSQLAGGHDSIALREALIDNHIAFDASAGEHRSRFDGHIGLHNVDEFAILAGLHGRRRN